MKKLFVLAILGLVSISAFAESYRHQLTCSGLLDGRKTEFKFFDKLTLSNLDQKTRTVLVYISKSGGRDEIIVTNVTDTPKKSRTYIVPYTRTTTLEFTHELPIVDFEYSYRRNDTVEMNLKCKHIMH